jgi:pimeloyl-ACP methyl ester carboxylesterase
MSQGCAVAIAFAVRHPQRVSHLVLYGGFAVGRFKRPSNTDADRERFAAMATLMKLGWGRDDPTFRQIFTSQLLPTATRQQADAFNELQRKSLTLNAPLAIMRPRATLTFDPYCPGSVHRHLSCMSETMQWSQSNWAASSRVSRARDSLRCPAKITFSWTMTLVCLSFSKKSDVF